MIVAMEDKKKRKPGRSPKDPGGRKKVQITARIAPDLYDRFEAFVEKYKEVSMMDVDRTIHLEKAIRLFLDREESKLDKPPCGNA